MFKHKWEKFDSFFGLSLEMRVLGHTDSLSEAIQKKALTASEAQHIAAMTENIITVKK